MCIPAPCRRTRRRRSRASWSRLVALVAEVEIVAGPYVGSGSSVEGKQLPQKLQQSRRPVDDEIGLIDECWWGFGRVHGDA
jgi:hypothetical protein